MNPAAPVQSIRRFPLWAVLGFCLLGLGACKLLGLGKGKSKEGCPINNQNLGAEKLIANGFAVPPGEQKKRERKRKKNQ